MVMFLIIMINKNHEYKFSNIHAFLIDILIFKITHKFTIYLKEYKEKKIQFIVNYSETRKAVRFYKHILKQRENQHRGASTIFVNSVKSSFFSLTTKKEKKTKNCN